VVDDDRPIAGVILAGGRSRRMGSPKVLLPLPDGTFLIARVASLLREVTSLVIVAGGGAELAALAGDGVQHQPDLCPGEGPLAALEGVFASRRASRYLVVAADQPRLTASLLNRLVNSGSDSNEVPVCFGRVGILEPLPVMLPASFLPHLRSKIVAGVRSLRVFLQELNPMPLPLHSEEAHRLASLNAPRDYAGFFLEQLTSTYARHHL